MPGTIDDLKKQIKNLERLVQSLQHQLWALQAEVRSVVNKSAG
jgi:prefoldin subunit 5